MRVIHKGRVLKDNDILEVCGVDGSEALYVAPGRASNSVGGGGAKSTTATTASANATPMDKSDEAIAASVAAEAPQHGGEFRVFVKGIGGLDATLEKLHPDTPLTEVWDRVATLCSLKADQIRLVHRGKLLCNDTGAKLSACGVAEGAVLHVARRAVQTASSTAAAQSTGNNTAAPNDTAVAPMPMAWGSGPTTFSTLLANQRNDPAALDGALAQIFQQQMEAARPPAQAQPVPFEVRIGREIRAMERQVRFLVAERHREEAAIAANLRHGRPPVEQDQQQEEEDPELLDHIARTMAEARARGVPVPNPAFFVDRAIERARSMQALRARLDREAGDMQPELEDALAVAEQSAAEAARAPRRLGNGK